MACCRHTPLPTHRPPRMPRRRKSTERRYNGREENGSPRGASDRNAGYRKVRRVENPPHLILPEIRVACPTRTSVLRHTVRPAILAPPRDVLLRIARRKTHHSEG